MNKFNSLKTFEDACKIEGIDMNSITVNVNGLPEKDSKSLNAYAKLIIVCRAANRLANDGKEWTPDFDNNTQRKYEIWWSKDEPGGSSGFRFDVYDGWLSRSNVGSRLCFISYEVAEHVGNQEEFVKLFNEFLL